MLISESYRALNAELHARNPTYGTSGSKWVAKVYRFARQYEATTVLDYGCGRGTFKPVMLQLIPDAIIREYDPGVVGKDLLELDPVDYVVCTDVMEHVEENHVDATLRLLSWFTKYGIFFNIDTALSRSFLPNGQNTHITIYPADWWLKKLDDLIPDMEWQIHEKTRSRLVVSGRRVQRDIF